MQQFQNFLEGTEPLWPLSAYTTNDGMSCLLLDEHAYRKNRVDCGKNRHKILINRSQKSVIKSAIIAIMVEETIFRKSAINRV